MKARKNEGNSIFSSGPRQCPHTRLIHSESLCISTFLDLKRVECPFQDIWNYTSHYDYNIVNPPNLFFFLCKNSALEVLRKPFNHLKACLQALDLKKKSTFRVKVQLPCSR